MKKPHQKS